MSTSPVKRTRADCTVRALAHVVGIDYAKAESIATEAGRRAGRGFQSAKLIAKAADHGFKFRKLRMGTRTLGKFLREHPQGAFYVRKAGHAFAVIDGVVSDGTSLGVIVKSAWQRVSLSQQEQS